MALTAQDPIVLVPTAVPIYDFDRLATAIIARLTPQTYTPFDVHVIVQGYLQWSMVAQIDGCWALAQCMHETGWLSSWWCQRPRRNPAGIGVTGRWLPRGVPASGSWQARGLRKDEGVAFATWDADAIPAHLGRLLAYYYPIRDGIPAAHNALIMRALGVRSLPNRYRGIAPTWMGLVQTWAVSKKRPPTGETYADKIAAIANMLAGS